MTMTTRTTATEDRSLAEFDRRLETRQTRIAVVGFGYVGSCLGAVLASRGCDVTGIDTDERTVSAINAGRTRLNEPGLAERIAEAHAAGRLRATRDIAAVANTDVVLLTVGTPLAEHGFMPDTSQVETAVAALAPHLRPGHLVILKSTAPPGTTDEVVAPVLAAAGWSPGEIFLAFCPERMAEGSALRELESIPVVVGASDEESRTRAVRFWRAVLDVDVIAVSNARTAEIVKLANNQWIDLNIAFGNELAKLADKLGVDVLEVIDAANSLPKGRHHVNILTPSMGVGGSCLTKDPWFVDYLGRQHGLELRIPAVGRAINDSMPAYTVAAIRESLEAAGKRLETSRVAVLGLAFKSDTGDCRSTPTAPAIAELEASGCELVVCDPLVDADDAMGITLVPLTPAIEDAVRAADCVAFFAGHRIFREFPLRRLAELAPGAVVLDGRMYFNRESIEAMRSYGLSYRGIGR
jgi:dTDP-alpha-D-glucose dehydrogenase